MAADSGAQSVPVPELAGRELELSLLLEHLGAARRGVGRAALLRGPAGIGKTRMVSAALDRLDFAGTVLTAKCAEIGASPYETLRALFAPLGLTVADHPLLHGSARLALPALLPDRDPGAAATDTYGVMHGLYWLTAGLGARGPVVIAVDDVQWCDEASLRWLGFLLRRAQDLPLIVLITRRPGGVQSGSEVLDEIADSFACLTLDLPPLTETAVGELLREAFSVEPHPDFTARCTELTGGNPFLVRQVAARLRAGSGVPCSQAVAELDGLGRDVVVRSLLDRLSAEAFAVAKAVAVLEGESLEMIAALAGTQPSPAGAAVQLLRAADLLEPESLEYAHDLIRHAVLQAVPERERVALRKRAARLLNDSGRPAEEVAVQLMLLPDDPEPWMVGVLQTAAAGAERRGAPAAAGEYLSRALRRDPDDVALLAASARALAHTDHHTAIRHLERALALVGDARQRAGLVVQYATTSLGAQNSLRAFALATEALDALTAEVGRAPAPADRALLTLLESACLLSGLDEKSTVRSVVERFGDRPAPQGDTEEERHLLGTLASLGVLQGRPATEVAAMAEKVLRIDEVVAGGWAMIGSSLPLYLADEVEPAKAALTTVVDHARSRGEAWTCALGASTRSRVHLWDGNVGKALSDAQFAFDIVAQEPGASAVVMPQVSLAGALVRRGEAAQAEQVLDRVARPRLDRFSLEYHWYLMARAAARAALGDPQGALDHLLRCGESLSEAGIDSPVLAPWWFEAAEVLAELDRADEGLEIVDRVTDAVRTWGTERSLGMLTMARGVLTEGDRGVEMLTEAVRTLEGTPGRLELAKAEYLLGRRLVARGDAEGARERLRRSIDLAVLCRDRLQLEQSLPALGEAGGRLRRGTASPTDALSGSERQVAERAAAGATNREIAESLFLTQRTVEFHLTSVYRKLGIRGRQELAPVLADS